MININMRSVGLLAAAIAPALLFAIFVEPIAAGVGKDGVLVLAVIAMAWALAVMIVYWRAIDEIAREGQKTAWFWGGICGALVAIAALSTPTPLQPILADAIASMSWLREATSAGDPASNRKLAITAVIVGSLYILIAQTIGFLAYWLAWWMVRR